MMRTEQQSVPAPATKAVNTLQAIRTRFTSGRPRGAKLGPGILGPMYAVGMASGERDRIRDFITERGESADDFVVQVAIVTARKGGANADRGHRHVVPETLDDIIALADKMKKTDGLLYAGFLVAVLDRKKGTTLRYTRPFVVSSEASEILARASLEQRFEKES